MTVTLDMPEDIEEQFAAAAQARGIPLSDYVRDFVVEHYQEDSDDLGIAQERLANPQPVSPQMSYARTLVWKVE